MIRGLLYFSKYHHLNQCPRAPLQNMNKLITQFLLLIITVFAIGCANSQSETPISPQSPQSEAQNRVEKNVTPINVQQLQRKTDQILIALATHQYKELTSLYKTPTSGVVIAKQLLGRKLFGAYLDTWRVEHIAVTIADDGLSAQTQTTTSYRMTPNQKRKHAIFKFHFSRPNKQSQWLPTQTSLTR